MQFCRVVLISLICMGLQSCVSPKMSQEVQLGKTHFIAGNYKQAFHSLLPAAACGNVQAQYAVGYMYYYGYGVPRDSESGLFWMRKAASQGYKPAINALRIIEQGPPAEGPCPGRRGCSNERSIYKGEQDAVMHSLEPRAANVVHVPHLKRTYTSYLKDVQPKTAPPVPVVKTVVQQAPVAPVVKKAIPVATKKVTQTAQHLTSAQYALQLFGAYQVEHVKELQADLELEEDTHIWHTQNKGKDWYVLTYGQYASAAEAKSEKMNLTDDLHDLGPWIRKLDGLEAVG